MVVDNDELCIPLIHTEIEGIGLLSAFLDELPKNKTVRFECVINRGFAAGLMLRGYEWDGNDLVLRPNP